MIPKLPTRVWFPTKVITIKENGREKDIQLYASRSPTRADILRRAELLEGWDARAQK